MYQVEMGDTSMWERWDSMLPNGTINKGEITSFNHYSVGSWIHGNIGGLEPLKPGWRRLRVEVVPRGPVQSAETNIPRPVRDDIYSLAERYP